MKAHTVGEGVQGKRNPVLTNDHHEQQQPVCVSVSAVYVSEKNHNSRPTFANSSTQKH